MAWQNKDGAEHESDVTRKLTDYNDSCNSDNEDNLEDSLEEKASLETDFDDIWDFALQKALVEYDEQKIQEFLNEDVDEDLKPLVFSAKAQREMIDALTESVGEEAATRIVTKQARKLEWERAQWKRERRRKRYNRVIKGMSVAAAVIVIFLGVGFLGDKAGAWSLPKISFNTIDRDTNSKVVLESGGDIVRTEIEQVYELGMVLDGYELVDSLVDVEMSYYVYVNADGKMYIFKQQIDSLALSINTEYKKEEVIDTLYGDAILYSFENTNCLIWNYQGYTFFIDGSLSKEQLLELQNFLKSKE